MRTRTVTTDDGRTLDVAEVGPEAGWPVLLHHGTPGSRLVLAHVAAAATRAGARLVVVQPARVRRFHTVRPRARRRVDGTR